MVQLLMFAGKVVRLYISHVGRGWGCRGGLVEGCEGRGDAKKHASWQGIHMYTFIILRTFARGRYSLIMSDWLHCS